MIRDLIALDKSSKLWIYQSDRDFTYDELDSARPRIFEFLDQWTSHNQTLLTYGNVFHKRFLVFFVDETVSGASGCSIDKSVHFVEELGASLGMDFFGRAIFSFIKDDEVRFINKADMKSAYQNNEIDDDTLFFDHLVKTKDDFLKKWLVPLNASWHKKFI
jgi:hypothetical protein